MSDQTSIEWTATVHPDGTVTPGSTWNPVRGCTKVSPGCAHCYAETFAERFRGVPGHPYEQGFDLRLVPEKLAEPLAWKTPRRVFVNSMSDLFQEGVPDSFIDQVFAVMALTPQHTYQVLTKRPERMQRYVALLSDRSGGVLNAAYRIGNLLRTFDLPSGRTFTRILSRWPLPNVWLGVSVENQHFADERIPILLQTPAAVRFLSAEPLLGPLELTDPAVCDRLGGYVSFLDWIIVGGESGSGARPCDLAWVRSIVQQCQTAGVACFVKQLGAHWYDSLQRIGVRGSCVVPVDSGFTWVKPGNKKGADPTEWPGEAAEWPRQFPEVRHG